MEESELKAVIRGILISNPRSMTVKELGTDFRKNEGMEVPFKQMGYNSLLDYLKSIPDTVALDASSRYNPVVTPVTNEKTSHIDSLVRRQRVPSSNRKSSYYAPPPVRRKSAIQPPPSRFTNQMDIPVKKPAVSHQRPSLLGDPPIMGMPVKKLATSHPPSLLGDPPIKFNNLNNYDSPSEKMYHKPESSIFTVPLEIVNLINHLCFSSKGCSFLDIDRSLRHDLEKAGIKNIADIQSSLLNYFDVKHGRVYRKSTGYSSSHYQSSSNNNVSPTKSGKTATEVAAAAVAATDCSSVVKKHVPTWAPATEFLCIPAGAESSMSRNYGSFSDDGSYGSDSAMKNLSNNEECAKVNLADFDDDDDGVESLVSSKIKRNLRYLINKYPEGIYCCDLERLYKNEFNCTLNYDEYGYDCLINMVSELKSIFVMKREKRNSDYKLFSASLQKNNTYIEDSTKKWVSREIIENICNVLEANPKGLPSHSLCDRYYDYHKKPLNPQRIGFNSVESLVDSISDHIHQRKVKDRILLYLKTNLHDNNCDDLQTPFSDKDVAIIYENDLDDPLPAREQLASLFSSIYPDEVCGPDDVYLKEPLPDPVDSPKYFEIRVGEVTGPHKFWIQFGRSYKKFDRMMVDLDEFYRVEESNYVMSDMALRPGQICACPYDFEEKWHRTIILNTCGAVEVRIEYVDYGTVSRVSKSKLRFLHKDFLELPAQAVRAKLISIIPPDGHDRWPHESCSKMLEMVYGKRLLMEAVICDYEANIIEGILYDTNGVEDIIINDDLVTAGFARFISINDSDTDGSDKNVGDNEIDLLDEPSPQLPLRGEKTSSLSTSSNVMDVSRESNTQSTSVSNFQEPNTKISSTPSVSTVKSSYTSGLDVSGSSAAFRPPPGFMPLTSSSNLSGIGAQSDSLTGSILPSFSTSNAIQSLPAQPPVVPKNANLDLLVNLLASKAVASATPNYFQNMYNNYQQPPYKSNQFNTYPEVNAMSLKSFPTASVNNNPLWYSMPCQTTNLPSPLGQMNRPAPPMLFPQPPSSNVSSPFPYTVPPTQQTPLPYNQQYSNYHMTAPYLPPQQMSQTMPYQWPSYSVPSTIPYSNNAPPPPGISNTHLQSSQVSFDSTKLNEKLTTSTFQTKQTNSAVNSAVENSNTITENISTNAENDLKNSPSKSSKVKTDVSANNNASDDEKQNKLSRKQRKKLEKLEQSSGASLLNKCSTNINVDSSDRSSNDEINRSSCHNDSNDNGASKTQEIKSSDSLPAGSKKELPLVPAAGNSKKKKKNKSESDGEQVNEEAALAQVSSTSLHCSTKINSISINPYNNINKINKDSDSVARSTSSVSLRSTPHCSYSSITPVALRRPKLLPSSNIDLLLPKTDIDETKKTSQGNTKEKNESSTSEVSTKTLPDVALRNISITSNDESVVDSWEELADDVYGKKKEISSNKIDNKDSNSKNSNNTTSISDNSNNKDDSKTKKKKEKLQKSNQDKASSTKQSKKSTSTNSKASTSLTTTSTVVHSSINTISSVATNTKASVSGICSSKKPNNFSDDNNDAVDIIQKLSKSNWIWGPSGIDNNNKMMKEDSKAKTLDQNDNSNPFYSSTHSNHHYSNMITSDTSDTAKPLINKEFENENTCEENEIPKAQDSVIKKVIGDKTIHLITESLDDKKIVVATDEFVKVFTPFSKRFSVLKVLDCKQIEKPFYDIYEKKFQGLFKELESFTIEAVIKKGESMPNKLNVLPLVSVPVVLKALNVDQHVIDNFKCVIEEMSLH